MLTDDQLAARTERAVAAATAAGRGLGLTITEPQVLYNVFLRDRASRAVTGGRARADGIAAHGHAGDTAS